MSTTQSDSAAHTSPDAMLLLNQAEASTEQARALIEAALAKLGGLDPLFVQSMAVRAGQQGTTNFYRPSYTPMRSLPVVAANVMPPFQPFDFTFHLASVNVIQKRCHGWFNLGTDTDYISMTGQVSGNPSVSSFYSMGNIQAEQTYSVNQSLGPFHVSDPSDAITLQYHIVNSSAQSAANVESILKGLGEKIVTSAIPAILGGLTGAALGAAIGGSIGSVIPVVGTCIGAIAGFLIGLGISVLDPNCDGPVADEVIPMTGAELWDQICSSLPTGNGTTWQKTTDHPGVNSPAGCGVNSDYDVTWSLAL